ncbi:MAG: ompC [Proteobacteria bacterium]|nr:ompC [Pseudomonadota bacterium]
MGSVDKTSYKRNGYDGGTRFRFASDYYLFDDISWVSYYELGVNIMPVTKSRLVSTRLNMYSRT